MIKKKEASASFFYGKKFLYLQKKREGIILVKGEQILSDLRSLKQKMIAIMKSKTYMEWCRLYR